MGWYDSIPHFLRAHAAAHSGQDRVRIGAIDYDIRKFDNDRKQLYKIVFGNGWHLLTQNERKDSVNTRRVVLARAHGGELYISWIMDEKGYRAKIETSKSPDGVVHTTVEDLRTHAIVWDSDHES